MPSRRVVLASGLSLVAGGVVGVAGVEPVLSDVNDKRGFDSVFSDVYAETGNDRGLLTITYRPKSDDESLGAHSIYLRGSGFADVPGASQVQPGPWQGSTNSAGRITDGDSVVVGVTSDYDICVKFNDPDNGKLFTLACFTGPDA